MLNGAQMTDQEARERRYLTITIRPNSSNRELYDIDTDACMEGATLMEVAEMLAQIQATAVKLMAATMTKNPDSQQQLELRDRFLQNTITPMDLLKITTKAS